MCHHRLQLIMPGLVVLLDEPFHFLGLASIALTVIVTLVGIRLTPMSWFDCTEEAWRTTYKVFKRISIVFCFFIVRR